MDRRLVDAMIFFGLGIIFVGLSVIVSATEMYMHVELGTGIVILGSLISIIGWRMRKRAILAR